MSLHRRLSGPAAGLGLAMAGGQLLSLVFTVVLAHVLGAAEYSSLAALIASWLMLVIPGTAMQVATAREIAGSGPLTLRATVRTLERQAALLTIALALAGALLRHPIAAVIGVGDSPWGAAAVLPGGGLWLLLSIQRGVLQGLGEYRSVGLSVVAEATTRIALAGVPAAAGAGASATWIAALLSLPMTSAMLAPLVRRRSAARASGAAGDAHDLRWLVRRSFAPAAAVTLLAVLQNVDVIVAKHAAASDRAGSYAAASLAAKAILWIAVGLGLYLLPETARRSGAGERTRRLLIESWALLLLAAVPVVVLFALFARPILTTVFGTGYGSASDVLPILGAAMTLLALTYLCAQYLLGLNRSLFLVALGVAAAAQPALLGLADTLEELAATLVAIQLGLLTAMVALTLARSRLTTGERLS